MDLLLRSKNALKYKVDFYTSKPTMHSWTMSTAAAQKYPHTYTHTYIHVHTLKHLGKISMMCKKTS